MKLYYKNVCTKLNILDIYKIRKDLTYQGCDNYENINISYVNIKPNSYEKISYKEFLNEIFLKGGETLYITNKNNIYEIQISADLYEVLSHYQNLNISNS